MLARTFESLGFATLIVTMMPVWSERYGAPRTLAVEHPFGMPMGAPGDAGRHYDVLVEALSVLSEASHPGTVTHSPYRWTGDLGQARKSWQPRRITPIVEELRRRGALGDVAKTREILMSGGAPAIGSDSTSLANLSMRTQD